MKKITGGVLVPLCSPCDADGRFLETEFAAALDEAMREDLDGAYICGGTGDGKNMRTEERKAAARIAAEICHKYDKVALLQIGAHTMREALELAQDAPDTGVDGISSVPLSGQPHDVQMTYYRRLNEVSGGMQTILYYMPQPGTTFPLAQVVETLHVPGVTGIKCSTNDFFFTQQLMAEKPEGTILFSGKDEYLAPAVIHGADGGIGMWATVFPKTYSGIYRLAKAGKLQEAFHLQSELNALCCIVMKNGLLQSFACILHYLNKHDRVFRAPEPQYDPAFYDRFIPEAATLIDRLVEAK